MNGRKEYSRSKQRGKRRYFERDRAQNYMITFVTHTAVVQITNVQVRAVNYKFDCDFDTNPSKVNRLILLLVVIHFD
jgi:hypothetical protein